MVFFFKQKTAYEMRISDWSSDVCSSDLHPDLDSVDVSIIGAWGEGAGSHLLTQLTREALVDSYLDTFRTPPLMMLLTDEQTNKYGRSEERRVGKECVSTCRSGWARDHYNKKTKLRHQRRCTKNIN